MRQIVLFLAIVSTAISALKYHDEYYEELFVKPLPSGHINTFFQFTTEWRFDNRERDKDILNLRD